MVTAEYKRIFFVHALTSQNLVLLAYFVTLNKAQFPYRSSIGPQLNNMLVVYKRVDVEHEYWVHKLRIDSQKQEAIFKTLQPGTDCWECLSAGTTRETSWLARPLIFFQTKFRRKIAYAQDFISFGMLGGMLEKLWT